MDNIHKFPKVNYIGNKEKIVTWIVKNLPLKEGTVLDLFSGGAAVSFELKKQGYTVISNDSLYSSFVLAKALVENSKEKLTSQDLEKAKNYDVKPTDVLNLNWLVNSLYFDYEVDELFKLVMYSKKLRGYKKYIFRSLIRRAMIRKLPYSRMNLDWKNITKLRDEEYSYEKYGRRRAYHNKSFIYHMNKDLESYNDSIFDNGYRNLVWQLDATAALRKSRNVDMIYMDPPYPGTMNKYDAFYGSFDKIFSKSISHIDLTNKKTFLFQFEKLVEQASDHTNYLIVSLNTNISPDYKDVINMLSFYGKVDLLEKKHNYQVSGKKNKNINAELLAIVTYYK